MGGGIARTLPALSVPAEARATAPRLVPPPRPPALRTGARVVALCIPAPPAQALVICPALREAIRPITDDKPTYPRPPGPRVHKQLAKIGSDDLKPKWTKVASVNSMGVARWLLGPHGGRATPG